MKIQNSAIQTEGIKKARIYRATTLKPPQHPVDKRVASGQLYDLGNVLQEKFLNAF